MVILAAIDGRTNSDRIVEVGADLANTYNDDLIVCHVISEERFEERREQVSDYYRSDAIEEAALTAREIIEETLSETTNIETAGRIGTPAEELLELAADHNTRYLVVGGRRRSPAGKLLFHSDTQEILLKSPYPVMTVMGPLE